MGYVRTSWYYGKVAARSIVYGPPAIVAASAFNNKKVGQEMMRRWCRTSSRGLGMHVDLLDAEHLEGVEQAVFIANHLSFLDILAIGAVLPHDYRWLAKASVFKVPMLGWHLKASGHIPVYRGAEKHRNADIGQRMQAVVEEGASLLFFPEGTRSEDGHLQPFRMGAFMAAVNAGLPVVPLVLRGTHEMLQKGSFHFHPIQDRPVTVKVLPSLHAPPEGDARARAEALRWEAYRAFMADLHPDEVVAEGQEVADERPRAEREAAAAEGAGS
ncbi:MAG: 1-acyl-sn-glycerol-3-phosphate acyltransferase [Myxococcales bacterium]|nr:1-acyl-sn-glycerol-3-phosphate acyltransferase [Myxococcales bacterium]MCB9545462.1 1-acyl-sn-glycerol-3-phosphate acyltransferase [Myxococcales bacterium]